jgi:hypothetical protein
MEGPTEHQFGRNEEEGVVHVPSNSFELKGIYRHAIRGQRP